MPLHLRQLQAVLLAAGLTILSATSSNADQNKLLIGESAVVPAIEIPVRAPVDLNFRSKAEVLDYRKKCAELTPNVVALPYQPSEAVFGQIEDGKPWWGLAGQGIWGPGSKSSLGASEESRFIVNPLLLAGANPAVVEMWDEEKVTDEEWQRSDFPLCWQPTFIKWWPKESLMQVEYPVSKFNQDLYNWRMKLRSDKIIPAFGVVAYNAIDFNLNYIYVDTAKSLNIENINKPPAEAQKLTQFIHCGGTCQIPGGCNNMSPEMRAIDRIKYTALPARAWISLWRDKPANINVKPDMVVYIDLK
ncbi:MAG: hypothetical protein HYX67_04395 [Candidatus Melainabacteria bacterium]|nr:hypothetical protein [Candidatus Melainabacteria bacterium]